MLPSDSLPAAAPSSGDEQSTVEPTPGGPVTGRLRPPGSKSLTNRALICAAMAQGRSQLSGALHSEDTAVMIQGLRQIGVAIDVQDAGQTLTVDGVGGRPTTAEGSVFIANSGTTIRFLTAALSAAGGQYYLHGVPRMHQRPIGDLVQALAAVVDGTVVAESASGCPPVRIDSRGWSAGVVEVAGTVSSQYLSGLLMAAPLARGPVEIRVQGTLVSRPYVEMTLAVMRSFGVQVPSDITGDRFVVSAPLPYHAAAYAIEPDASAASYFWAAAAISGGRVTVDGLSADALQGDVAFCNALSRMGCCVVDDGRSITVEGRSLRGIEVDMNAISDTVQTLAVVALFARGPTTITGVAHNRFKETDRIGDLARELRKLGAVVQENDDGLTIVPPDPEDPPPSAPVVLETYHDHRMAMSLALAGLKMPGVRVANPACTAKTYPEYFADLETLTGRPHHWRHP